MKETTDTNRTDLVRTIASDAEERGGAIVRYVSVAEGRVARLDAVPSDVLGGGAGYVAANVKTKLGGGLAVATSTVKPGSMESAVARWKHQVDTFAAVLVAKWAPGIGATCKTIASHRMTPVLAFGALLALLTALALRLWQQRRWVSALALGSVVTLLAPGCDCTWKQGAGRNPRDASTLIAELPADAVFYHGDWQGSPVATTDAAVFAGGSAAVGGAAAVVGSGGTAAVAGAGVCAVGATVGVNGVLTMAAAGGTLEQAGQARAEETARGPRGTPRQAQQAVRREQAPKEIKSIHGPEESVSGSQWHAHQRQEVNGRNPALNLDGTPHDGVPDFSKKALKWLESFGWSF